MFVAFASIFSEKRSSFDLKSESSYRLTHQAVSSSLGCFPLRNIQTKHKPLFYSLDGDGDGLLDVVDFSEVVGLLEGAGLVGEVGGLAVASTQRY